jgi:nicotinate-nucleotide pyrophosphorylase (carboxylating)
VSPIPGVDLDRFAAAVLAEDLGGWSGGGAADAARDITAAAIFAPAARLAATLHTREAITLAGLPVAAAIFAALDPDVQTASLHADGDRLEPGTPLLRLEGSARALLAAERSALNILQHLSGVATLTRRYADAISGTGVTLLDTRKTLPGLRHLEKYAVRMGGGTNHRMGLHDAPMVKDNHVAAAGGVAAAVRACKAAGLSAITVEVDRLDQIEPAVAAGADRLLLDNMALGDLAAAVRQVAGRVPTEASGGVRLETVCAIADTGVTFISVGRITQSAPAADIGMDFG